jgi:hypothetical protein
VDSPIHDEAADIGGSSPILEEEDEPREVEPPPEPEVEALTPAVRVVDASGAVVGTRPTLHHIGTTHRSDMDGLYCEGLDVSADGKQLEHRLREHTNRGQSKERSSAPLPNTEHNTSGQSLEGFEVSGGYSPLSSQGDTPFIETGDLVPPHEGKDTRIPVSQAPAQGKQRQRVSTLPPSEFGSDWGSSITIPLGGTVDESTLEDLDANGVLSRAITTDGKLSYYRICKKLNAYANELPAENHDLFRVWLLTKPVRDGESVLQVEDLPATLCQSRSPLLKGLKIPYPAGPHWRRLKSDPSFRTECIDRVAPDDIQEEEAYAAMRILTHDLKTEVTCRGLAMLARAALAEQASLDEVDSYLNALISTDIEALGMHAYAARKLRKRQTKVEGSSEEPPPKTIVEALMGDRAEGWVQSIYDEFKGLEDQGVFSHDWTLEDLRAEGIRGRPIPCSIALTHKYKDGILMRLKTRICIAGHRGNVVRGIHYHDVFSPSPVQHTERLLQAMMVNLHLHNIAWDVKLAYTWAPLPKGERVAVIYPDGFKRTNKEGKELFLVLERNLYGMPSASRGWGKHRDAFILSHFNEPGWSCAQSRNDPCLFIIDKQEKALIGPQPEIPRDSELDLDPSITRSWVLIHTDDCDAYGQDLKVLNEINDAMNNEWKTELVDREIILGVKRTLVTDSPQGWYCTLTMSAFIADLASNFSEPLARRFGNRRVRTPFPEHRILTKADKPREGEVERNIQLGYQRLVGSLLWIVRHVAPIAVYGMSQLCKLMATPTDDAWDCALHLLKYLHQNKERGIRFSECDYDPLGFVDASNRDDPFDGLCQYSFALFWGGPLIVKSGKLSHVGINSTYNEYMALHHAIKQIVWLRKIMSEIGLGAYVSEPTRVYADNKQANNLCSEDLVTAGNMYFRTGYHYNKEAVRDREVSVHFCPTLLNVTDMGTKALGPIKSEAFEPQLHGFAPLPEIPKE